MRNTNQASLFGLSEMSMPEIKMIKTAEASKKERLTWEKELLGLYITDHPVKEYQDYLNKMTVRLKNIDKTMVGQNITVGGVISKIHKIITKRQQTMLFVTIEDIDTNMELLVFPKTLEATGSIWEEEKIILATGRLSDKDGVFKLLTESVKTIDPKAVEEFKRVMATQKTNGYKTVPLKPLLPQIVPSNPPLPPGEDVPIPIGTGEGQASDNHRLLITLPSQCGQDSIKKLSHFFDSCDRGPMKVILEINNAKLETPYCIKKLENMEEKLKNIFPEGRIKIV
jgi:hypothetical protein